MNNQKYRTYFLVIVVIFFAFFRLSLAAHIVPGTLPQNTPLQPVPVDTFPNLSHNVIDSSHANQQSSSSEQTENSGQGQQPFKAVGPQANTSNGFLSFGITILIILLLAGIGYAIVKLYGKK